MPKTIVYIAGCIPTLTCTFIQREIFDLESLGFRIETVSMNSPQADSVSSAAKRLMESMLFLDRIPEYRKYLAFTAALATSPRAMIRCFRLFVTANPMNGIRDYMRLGYHLIEACFIATALKEKKPDHIHCHFIHGPTSLGMFLAELLGIPFSFTMHASLIWTDPIALHTKLSKCSFCISISDFNKKHVLNTYGREFESKITVIHCGVELPDKTQTLRTLGDGEPASVLAIGQLKRRKGFHVLVEAAGILRERGVPVKWTIVGEGDQRDRLEKLIRDNNVGEEVVLAGAQLHEKIPAFLAGADIFTIPCVIGNDNTRDGIPVALMEAMARGLPVVSTNIVGLPELIDSGNEGLLVEPDDPAALADAIATLAESQDLRQRLGREGARKIEREFNSRRSAQQLASLFAMQHTG